MPKQEEKNNIVLFDILKSGIKGSEKQHVRKEITKVKTVDVDNQSPADTEIFMLDIHNIYPL